MLIFWWVKKDPGEGGFQWLHVASAEPWWWFDTSNKSERLRFVGIGLLNQKTYKGLFFHSPLLMGDYIDQEWSTLCRIILWVLMTFDDFQLGRWLHPWSSQNEHANRAVPVSIGWAIFWGSLILYLVIWGGGGKKSRLFQQSRVEYSKCPRLSSTHEISQWNWCAPGEKTLRNCKGL